MKRAYNANYMGSFFSPLLRKSIFYGQRKEVGRFIRNLLCVSVPTIYYHPRASLNLWEDSQFQPGKHSELNFLDVCEENGVILYKVTLPHMTRVAHSKRCSGLSLTGTLWNFILNHCPSVVAQVTLFLGACPMVGESRRS